MNTPPPFPVEDDALAFLRANVSEIFIDKDVTLNELEGEFPYLFALKEGLMVGECFCSADYVPLRFVSKGQGVVTSLVPGAQAGYRLRSLSPSTLLVVSLNPFLEALRRWPNFHLTVTMNLVRRTNIGYQRRARVLHMDMAAQIAFLLWELGAPLAESSAEKELSYAIPQKTLGAYFGIPREEVSRKLKALETAGHIAKHNKGYLLKSSLPSVFQSYGVEQFPAAELVANVLLGKPLLEPTRPDALN